MRVSELARSVDPSRGEEEEEDDISSTAAYCVPGPSEVSRFFDNSGVFDFKAVLESRLVDWGASVGTWVYEGGNGVVRRNGMGAAAKIVVPMVAKRRNVSASSLIPLEALAKKNALSPKAASGKAVAVPLCAGKLTAAREQLVEDSRHAPNTPYLISSPLEMLRNLQRL